jgi:hypothetical protein
MAQFVKNSEDREVNEMFGINTDDEVVLEGVEAIDLQSMRQ